MKKLEKIDLKSLKKIQKLISEYKDLTVLKNDVDRVIALKEKEYSKRLNVRFDIEMMIRLGIFNPWELKVVKSNHIANMQELIDCDLDSMVGTTESVKQGLEWARRFYDMSPLEKKSRSNRIK